MSTQVAMDTTYVMQQNAAGNWFWQLFYKGEMIDTSLPLTWKDADYRKGTNDAYVEKQRFISSKLDEVRNG